MVPFPEEANVLISPNLSRQAMVPTQFPLNGQRRHSPQGLKRLAREADYPNPSSVEVRKKWSCTSAQQMVTVLNTKFYDFK